MMSAPFRRIVPALLAVAICAAAGCKRETISVYTAPKDVPAPTPDARSASNEGAAQGQATRPRAPRPPVKWGALPAGWQETEPGQVSAANFAIKSDAGEATMNITPLPNMAGREAMVVSMWRQQVGLPELAQEEVAKELSPVEVAGGQGQLFEIEGARETKAMRIVTAMLHQPEASWFFKLAGDEAAVQAQKPAFIEFLKTVRVGAGAAEGGGSAAASPERTAAGGPPHTPASPQPPSAGAPQPSQAFAWTVPEGWQPVAAGQMQVAKFTVPPQGDAKAEVAVSTFPSDTGGTLANVNRWRGQLGLGPLDEAGLSTVTSPLDPATPDAVLIDLANEKRRMLGAIVPRDGKWWFYKMMGDDAAVNAARDAFVSFARSAP